MMHQTCLTTSRLLSSEVNQLPERTTMPIFLKKIFFSVLVLLLITPCFAGEPQNLYFFKQKLTQYHDSGQYEYDIDHVAYNAENYLKKRIQENRVAPHPQKLAIVFDLDETLLSNYADLSSHYFSESIDDILKGIAEGRDTIIPGTFQLYQYAESQGVAVFFITGRPERLQTPTESNLKKDGITQWTHLYFKPNDYSDPSIIPFKSSTRAKIEQQGYDIAISIGDQYSDLLGGYADHIYKLPNPFYFLP